MTLIEIEQGNKLIAEFMATIETLGQAALQKKYLIWVKPNGSARDLTSVPFNASDAQDCRYHSSWDWLMPVIEKIIDEEMSSCMFTGDGYLSGAGKTFSMMDDHKTPFQGNDDKWIRAAWIAIVQYLEWKNKKKL